MDWQVHLEKARGNLRAAVMACDAGEYDPAVSRAYYAVFHAEIAALLKLTDFRPPRWDYDRVQAEFNRRLIHARKVFSTALRFIHNDLLGRRHIRRLRGGTARAGGGRALCTGRHEIWCR